MSDTQHAVNSLSNLRNHALLLSVANEYLCEDIFLNKFGNTLTKNIEQLEKDIVDLKKEFPGKFQSEVDTKGILEKINSTAQEMIGSDQKMQKVCASAELGQKLESDIRAITEAVNEIKNQVYGHSVRYTKKDSVAGAFENFKNLGRSFGSLFLLGIKIFLGLILIGVVIFLFLFFTMEREGKYLKRVDESRIYIENQKEVLSQMDHKKAELSEEIKTIDSPELGRDKKISLLDKEVEIHKINQDRKKIEAEIVAHEKKISENQQRIEEIRKIPFLNRLLRRAD